MNEYKSIVVVEEQVCAHSMCEFNLITFCKCGYALLLQSQLQRLPDVSEHD